MVTKVKESVPLFQPGLTDSRGGAFTGINLTHTTGHFLRSIMEGIAIEVRKRLEDMKEAGEEYEDIVEIPFEHFSYQ